MTRKRISRRRQRAVRGGAFSPRRIESSVPVDGHGPKSLRSYIEGDKLSGINSIQILIQGRDENKDRIIRSHFTRNK